MPAPNLIKKGNEIFFLVRKKKLSQIIFGMYLLINSALGTNPWQETYVPPWIPQIEEPSG